MERSAVLQKAYEMCCAARAELIEKIDQTNGEIKHASGAAHLALLHSRSESLHRQLQGVTEQIDVIQAELDEAELEAA